MGFTLTELLVAAFIGMLTATVAGQTLVSHLQSSEKAEAMERQRNDWSRTTSFIEAEIALSERLINNSSNVLIPSGCPIATTSTPSEFRFAIDMRRDLPLVIYAVKASTSDWLPNNTLWRCGPGLDADGSYNNSLEWSPMLDGLDGDSAGGGFSAAPSTDGKHASFTLALKGHATVKYGSIAGARTRISPLYSRPSDGSLCDASNLVKVAGNAEEADVITVPVAQINSGEDVLVCGYGGGDSITGSEGNDIIESGDDGSSDLHGGKGSDVLRGTNDSDNLFGGENNDALIGRGGNDLLDGGSGQNIYLPGAGADTVEGGQGLDIVFFEGVRMDFETNQECSKTQCTVINNKNQEKDELSNIEILIFNDARLDLPN